VGDKAELARQLQSNVRFWSSWECPQSKATVVIARNGARNAAKTGGPMESALLESRRKPLILLIELKAHSGFWYKYTIEC